MDPSAIADELARLPHFRSLERSLVERVAALSHVRSLGADEILFRQGEPCRAFFAVREGGVRLYRASPDGREQLVHVLGSGRTFAEAALFNLGRYPVNAVATETPTGLIEVGGESFLELFHAEPRLSGAMVGSLCQRMLELVTRVEELSVQNAGARLARHLLRLSTTGADDPPAVELDVAKKDLAAMLAIAPETLSRLLRGWRERGVVEVQGRRVALLDVPALEALADGEPPA